MARRDAAPPPPPPVPRPLYKLRSWSPDPEQDEAWLRRKERYCMGLRRSQSFTNDDLEELKGFIDLGFVFNSNSPELDPKLSETLPALPFYCAVNHRYNGGLSRSSSTSSIGTSSDTGSTCTMIDLSDDPEIVKARLRQWARAVAWSVRQFSGEPS